LAKKKYLKGSSKEIRGRCLKRAGSGGKSKPFGQRPIKVPSKKVGRETQSLWLDSAHHNGAGNSTPQELGEKGSETRKKERTWANRKKRGLTKVTHANAAQKEGGKN